MPGLFYGPSLSYNKTLYVLKPQISFNVAQLVQHCARHAKVVGSIPRENTFKQNVLQYS